MNEREMLLRRLSSAQFAAWEMHIFLDTHPDDQQAIASYQKYHEKAQALIKEFEEKYGPITSSASAFGEKRWEWINNPWPWENEKETKN